jgi:RimJ/RimL family protein N-acetyltransferase
MNTSYLFTSERLGFRNWCPADIAGMASINANPEVMKFFPATQDREQTAAFIKRMQQLYTERGFCYFAVETLEQEDFIGFIGLAWQEYTAPFTPCVDMGWRLKPEAWGKGYATEGATRCLAFAFSDLGLEKVIATAPLLNIKSISVMEQTGMQPLLQFKHPALTMHPELELCAAYIATRPLIT